MSDAVTYARAIAAIPTLERIRLDQKRARGAPRRLLEMLEAELFDPDLNIKTARARLGLSDNSLSMEFRRQIGIPPRAYVAQCRLEVAARLLVETEFKIWRIAEAVGYSGLGVFSKAFDRWVGLRPRVYRQ